MVSYNKKVQFCGAMRKFKRCPNRTLKDYQKSIEDIQKEVMPIAKKLRDYQFEINELQNELSSLEEYIDVVKNFDNASDEEIRESLALIKEKTALQRRIHDLIKMQDDFRLDNEKVYDDLDDKLRMAYGEFASMIFEDFDASEIEEADPNDLVVAPRLSELYRLATTGANQKEVDELYNKIIKDSFQ